MSPSFFDSLRTLFFLAAFLPACGETSGALGQIAVSQGCAGSTLPCQGASDFSAPIAVGTTVPLSVDLMLMGGGQPPLELVSTDERVFTVASETLTGVAPGLATVLFLSEDAVVVDFIAIWVQQASTIAVSRLDGGQDVGEVQATLSLLVADRVPLAVSAASANEALAGAARTTWTVADPAVATMLDDGLPGRATVVGRAGGTTTVTASMLGLEHTFTVQVTP